MKNLFFVLFLGFTTLFAQWQYMGLGNRSVTGIASINGVLFAGTDNKIYKSTDDGVTWAAVTNPSPYYYTFSVVSNGSTLVAWSYGDYTYNSTDLGQTWTPKAQVPNLFEYWKQHGNDIYAGTGNALFRSNNFGQSYEQLTIGAEFDPRGVAVDGTDIWAGSYKNGLWHSTNDGQTWTNITAGISTLMCSDVIREGNIIIVGTRGEKGINRSTDNGQTWDVINPTWDVSSFYQYAGNIFAFKYGFGSEAGPIRSTDNGQTWQYANEGLISNVSLFFKHKDYLYAGLEVGGGIWRRKLSDWGLPSDVKEVSFTPGNFSLSDNYPNPFNPSTKIAFSVPQSGEVTLKVYNAIGQEIATLINKVMNAGSYEADFNASTLNSGVYYYKLTAGGNSITKKMLLVK